MTRVICVGHPLLAVDQAGPQLYRRLAKLPTRKDVELIDGGLQGLNLLRCFEGCERVILVDNVCGYLPRPGIVHLQDAEIDAAVGRHFDHSAGLAYLLAMLPQLLDAPPRVELLGIEGELTDALTREAVERLRQLLDTRSAA